MISSADVRNITFSNSMAGYKKDEVDILLDKIEVDLEKYENITRNQTQKISNLEAQIAELKESQNSIQSVLLNAQKLADSIVAEAKAKSNEIIADAQNNISDMTEKSKLLAQEFDTKANEKKERLEKDISEIIKTADEKKARIEAATAASVKNQQELFDKLKVEVALFKAEITEKYRQHLILISSIPDAVDVDPETAAKLADEDFENEKSSNPQEALPEEKEEISSDEPEDISETKVFSVNETDDTDTDE